MALFWSPCKKLETRLVHQAWVQTLYMLGVGGMGHVIPSRGDKAKARGDVIIWEL